MRYDIVLMDPPWEYYGDPNKPQAAGKHYECMSAEEMSTLRVNNVINPRAIVFIWTTSAMMERAILLGTQSWELYYRGVAFVWVKTRKDGGVIGSQGVRASITKPTTEFVLAFSRLNSGRPMKIADETVGQVVLAPRGEHSEKPVIVHERIEAMYPDAKKLELFARQTRPGWDSKGYGVGTGDIRDFLG